MAGRSFEGELLLLLLLPGAIGLPFLPLLEIDIRLGAGLNTVYYLPISDSIGL